MVMMIDMAACCARCSRPMLTVLNEGKDLVEADLCEAHQHALLHDRVYRICVYASSEARPLAPVGDMSESVHARC